jgi:hypothetical protein
MMDFADSSLQGVIDRFAEGVALPEVRLARRQSHQRALCDLKGASRAALRRALSGSALRPGPVAVGVGSRGDRQRFSGLSGCVGGSRTAASGVPWIWAILPPRSEPLQAKRRFGSTL